MKRILIVGKNSYIGTSFEKWLAQWPDQYAVDTIDTLGDCWREYSFGGYDSVLHVAGIAHVTNKPGMEELYLRVNRDLAIEAAQKAKQDGAKQFIFMSSIIIYGEDGRIGEPMVITADTVPQPANVYGRSKLEADLTIQKLMDGDFKTVVIRTPMVYGPGCKGNFPKLIKLAKVCPVFPDIDNERSMIYIDNLCEFLRLCVDKNSTGVFYPQNKEKMSTKSIIVCTRKHLNKKTILVSFFNPLLCLASRKIGYINKIFGNKVYHKDLSNDSIQDYHLINTNSTIFNSLYAGTSQENVKEDSL